MAARAHAAQAPALRTGSQGNLCNFSEFLLGVLLLLGRHLIRMKLERELVVRALQIALGSIIRHTEHLHHRQHNAEIRKSTAEHARFQLEASGSIRATSRTSWGHTL